MNLNTYSICLIILIYFSNILIYYLMSFNQKFKFNLNDKLLTEFSNFKDVLLYERLNIIYFKL
jgi:hypothetical protein